jgi:hypothetical protein
VLHSSESWDPAVWQRSPKHRGGTWEVEPNLEQKSPGRTAPKWKRSGNEVELTTPTPMVRMDC